jgi:DNA-binding transcriptional MerR regulator
LGLLKTRAAAPNEVVPRAVTTVASKKRTSRNSKPSTSSKAVNQKPPASSLAGESQGVQDVQDETTTASTDDSAQASKPARTKSAAGAGEDRLKIGEVARQAGVAPSVITYYVSEGLLPRPVKTSRNMAYYTPDTVDRVRLIRELREKAYLPLRVVKKVLSTGATTAEIRETFVSGKSNPVTGADSRPTEAALLEETELNKNDLREMEKMAILSPRVHNGRRTYSKDDVLIVREIAKMRDTGLNSKRGYTVKQLLIYRRAVEKLAQEEIELAIEGVVGSIKPADLAAVGREWIQSANEIVAAMHRKALRRLLGDLGTRMDGD